MPLRRPGEPAALVAGAGRIYDVLGWEPRLDNLDTIVEGAFS
jgi:UDP-glucose 4-epimerase